MPAGGAAVYSGWEVPNPMYPKRVRCSPSSSAHTSNAPARCGHGGIGQRPHCQSSTPAASAAPNTNNTFIAPWPSRSCSPPPVSLKPTSCRDSRPMQHPTSRYGEGRDAKRARSHATKAATKGAKSRPGGAPYWFSTTLAATTPPAQKGTSAGRKAEPREGKVINGDCRSERFRPQGYSRTTRARDVTPEDWPCHQHAEAVRAFKETVISFSH